MKSLPDTPHSLVLRTDFSDPDAWEHACRAIETPVGEFKAYVTFVSDREYEGLSVDQLLALASPDARSFVFVVDRGTLSSGECPVLVVDLVDHPGRSFRVVASEMWGVENNLSIANMDFEDFASSVDHDGVFRGFSS